MIQHSFTVMSSPRQSALLFCQTVLWQKAPDAGSSRALAGTQSALAGSAHLQRPAGKPAMKLTIIWYKGHWIGHAMLFF